MTREILYGTLLEKFRALLEARGIEAEKVPVSCRTLSPTETIGETQRKDFPIMTGKDVMILVTAMGGRGQAFSDAPSLFEGTLADVLAADVVADAHARGIFVASLNAVMNALGLCTGTVHCRTEGPELCAGEMDAFLRREWPEAKRIGLIGYQPALTQMLSESHRQVRVLDLNPANVGQLRHGVLVENGAEARDSLVEWADLILCTGSTLSNGTITDYLDLPIPVLFYGISAAGASVLLGLRRVCFADRWEG